MTALFTILAIIAVFALGCCARIYLGEPTDRNSSEFWP